MDVTGFVNVHLLDQPLPLPQILILILIMILIFLFFNFQSEMFEELD
jgi:hypothetical protein